MKLIPLNHGWFAKVDDCDFDWLSQWKWSCSRGYAVRNSSRLLPNRKTIWMHREIIKTPDGLATDHINCDRLDNRRSNLRVCTQSENTLNKAAYGTSGYKGVVWDKHAKRWHARIARNKKKHSLGYFDTAEEAARSYDNAAKALHGEFASLNFPDA